MTTTAAAVFVSLLLHHHLLRPSTAACPPFSSTPPPFPFSSTPGTGHPAFQIQCATPRATISINNSTFSVLHYDAATSSVLLSPAPFNHTCTQTPYAILPAKPISLSGSPFRVSDSYCSRLAVLRPCPPPILPNCSRCSWLCKLIKNPAHLIEECRSSSSHRHDDSEHRCRRDVLGFLDSFLNLGFEVTWDETDSYFSSCKSCRANNTGSSCGFDSAHAGKPFACFGHRRPQVQEKGMNKIAILSTLLMFMSFLIILFIGTVIIRKRHKQVESEEDPTVVFLRRHRSASLLPPVFTYEELAASTNRFDPKRKLGDGGFGSVFLGQLNDGLVVAVKHLHKHLPGTKSFCNEILILSSLNHPHLVKLHGYCSDPRGLLLVYEYVPNGSLADHLHGSGKLSWNSRINIALQTAMAIEYLHFAVLPPIVHRDITSTNIFVGKDMRVKVGDFGLSRLLRDDSSGGVWTGPQGTPGYLDPDYHRSFLLNEKSDIYSFGVVLLELITGMKAVDLKREKRETTLADLVVLRIQMGLLNQVVDPILVLNGDAVDGVAAAAELAFRCVAADKDDRPDAKEVVEELRRIRGRTKAAVVGGGGGAVVVPDNSGTMS